MTRKEFITEIAKSELNKIIASDMLFHFKVYLMQALGTCQKGKAGMLFEAQEFYTFRLKKLIEKVLDERPAKKHRALLNEMDRNFRFYYHCIEKDNIKYMLTKKFRSFKTAIKSDDSDQIKILTEDMTFLAGILLHDRSSIFGLNLIADQTPEFVGYFLIMQRSQIDLLKGHSILDDGFKFYHSHLLE
jgi:hypothetical protein